MPRYGIGIDTTRCVGCQSCRVACQNQQNLDFNQAYNWIKEREVGRFPSFDKEFIPYQCMQCENPPCQRVCPTAAIYTSPEGVVLVHPERCIGCKYCIQACPYRVRLVDEHRGIVIKCWFCIDLVRDGGKPACVTTCPTQVRVFGDLDDPESDISKFIAQNRAEVLRADLNTKPKIFYKRS
jgi:Fe-S-cluster-containing dehydrogenase component